MENIYHHCECKECEIFKGMLLPWCECHECNDMTSCDESYILNHNYKQVWK